jgi:hypothetical protein
MSEHEHTEPEAEERTEDVEDLEVPEGQQEGVEGGFLKWGQDEQRGMK